MSNKLTIKDNNVFLELENENGRKRKIGSFFERKGIKYYVKNNPQSFTNRITGEEMFGVSELILEKLRDKDIVMFDNYTLTKEEIIEKGMVMKFQGYEKQIFVSLEEWRVI